MKLAPLLRSALAGGAATATDLLVLFTFIQAGCSPRVASVPALIAGGVVNFYGNRTFAFRATAGAIERQAMLFTLSELVTLALNGVLYDLAVRTLSPSTGAAMVIRLVAQNLVFLAWSFPIWRLVFATKRA